MLLSSSKSTFVGLVLLYSFLGSTFAQRHNDGRASDPADIKTAPEFTTASVPAIHSEPSFDPTATRNGIPIASERDAESPRTAPVRLGAIDHDHMMYDMPGDGSLWARGANWKASFDSAGVTYYPAFGKRAPHDLQHVLSPDFVSIGNTELAFDRSATAVRHGDHIAIDRGAFVETYALTPQAIEQAFVFSEIPPAVRTRGDLAVHIPIASELEARATADGIEFRSEFGQVIYGQATVVDARGRRANAGTELVDGSIVIRVDAAFLASATLPLVIDPVVSTIAVNTSIKDDGFPDTAFDAANQRWLVTYEEFFSASDHDVLQALYDAAGTLVFTQHVDITTNSWDNARCANMASAQRFLVVASVTNATGGAPKYIAGRTIQAQDGSMSAQITISGGEVGDLVQPVVGGDPIGSNFCVVYQRNFSSTDEDILVRLVDANVATTVGPNFFSNSSGTLDAFPSVSKSNDGTVWLLAWQRDLTSSSQIWAGRIGFDGTVQTAPFAVTPALETGYFPSASSPLHGTQLSAIAYEAVTSPNNKARVKALNGGTVVSETDMYDPSSSDEITPSVDSDGQHFVVVYGEAINSVPTHKIFAQDLGLSGTSLVTTQFRISLGTGTNDEEVARVASAHGSGGPLRRFLAVWEQITPSSGGDIHGALLDAVEGGSVFGLCLGNGSGTACPCGNNGTNGCANSANPAGASLFGFGEASTITDGLSLQASGMPASTTCLFFQGTSLTSPATTFGDGLRCVGGSIIRLGTKAASGGSATYPGPGDQPVSVRGAVPVDGPTRYYQGWYRNAASFCTISTFNTTNALIVEWAR